METVFITGAEGYLGSNLLEYLRNRGYEVVAGVRNRARKLAYERRNLRALVCDVADAINVARAVASVRPDAVVQLAGITNPVDALSEPLLAYQTMVTGCANLLDAVRRTVPRSKVLIVSAAEVYGQAASDGAPITESTHPQPVTTFGSLKRAAETLAATFFRDYHLNVTIARPFQALGGRMPERFLFGQIVRQLASHAPGDPPPTFTSPDFETRRDFLHVADVATALERIMSDGRPNEVYNICSSDALPVSDVARMISAEFGVDASFSSEQPYADQVILECLRGDHSKLKTELNWTPQHSLADAVRDLVASTRPATALAPT